jgi:hypothetical protein
MPFDVVVIENFNRLDPLSLKNLIGRAGRSTKNGGFDYGYAIVNSRNRDTVINRLKQDIQISDDSKLDRELDTVDEDEYDIVEAIKSNEFNDKYNLPKAQLDRLEDSDIDKNIKFLLDTIILNDSILKGNDYYDLSDGNRSRIKKALREIYTTHLKRKQLSQAEKNVLSTALPILLWRVQGKSFKEIVSIRFHFLTEQKEQTRLKKTISDPKEADAKIEKLKIRFSQVPAHIPNKKITVHSNFEKKNVVNLQYDEVVYDTYDYLDKVISLSIVDPLYAAFSLYAERSGDNRAQDMANYIRYGTNDEKEIWLLKYGFDFEDIEWILPHVRKIDEREIVFRRSIYNHLSEERWETIKRYL